MLDLTSSILVVCALLFAIAWVIHWKHYLQYKHIPGFRQFLIRLPIPIPFLSPQTIQNMDSLLRVRKETGSKTVALTAFNSTHVTISNIEDVKYIMVKKAGNFPKPYPAYSSLRVYGENLLTITAGSLWKKHRLLCNPAFSDQHLSFMIGTAVNSFYLMDQKRWSSNIIRHNGETFHLIDAERDLTDLTLDVIGKAGFGYNLGILEDIEPSFDKNKYSMSLRTALETTLTWGLPIHGLFPNFIATSSFLFPTLNAAYRDADTYMNEIIQKGYHSNKDRLDLLSLLTKLNENADNQIESGDKDEASGEEDHSYSALPQNTKLSNEEIKSDTYIFLVAGHETSTTLIQWVCYYLAKHQDIQDRARVEVEKILGIRNPQDMTLEDVKNLKYVAQVLNETLRIRPPVPLVPKTNAEEFTLPSTGYKIPKGSEINIYIEDIHRDPDNWKDPMKFDPDRFEDMSKINPFTFIPFSIGHRKCIGLSFAMLESAAIVANLLKNYRIIFDPRFIKDPANYVPDTWHIVTVKPYDLKIVFQKI